MIENIGLVRREVRLQWDSQQGGSGQLEQGVGSDPRGRGKGLG